MALIDALSLSILKSINMGTLSSSYLFLPVIIYSLQPLIFFQSLQFESMTVMNLLWDVISDIFVTFIGLAIFREKISRTKTLGVVTAFVAIFLLSWTGGELI